MSGEPSNDEQAAAQRSVERAFPAVARFLAETATPSAGAASDRDARPDADLMRVDAPQVDGQRLVTVRLLDAPGATMTVPCPDWCEFEHAEDIARGTFAIDFAHRGADEALHVDLGDGDSEDVLLCEITQYPFSSDLRTPTVVMWPTLGMGEAHLDPSGLLALADQLRAYANALDDMAVTLDSIRTCVVQSPTQTPGGLR